MSADKLALIRQLVESARSNLTTATQLLQALGVSEPSGTEIKASQGASVQRTDQGSVIIEGVFDGQNMVGPDGKLYSVPANYASKSKLVEGDMMKLTISPDGSFIYKQVGPVERERIVGVLTRDEQTDEFRVLARGINYKVLLASITYFKSELGDEVVILIPKGTPSTWAAVENVINKFNGQGGDMPSTEVASEVVPEPVENLDAPVEAKPIPKVKAKPVPKVPPVEVSSEDEKVPLVEI